MSRAAGTTFGGTARPPCRPWHASTELESFLMVTYRVDPERLRRVTPARFEPRLCRFDDGGVAALVSAVMFFDRDFHFRFLPALAVSCGQINYRAYGSFDGEEGVWFFGTSLDSIFVLLPEVLWQMPWHLDRIRIRGSWCGDRPLGLEVLAAGRWGTAACSVEGVGPGCGRLDGFADESESLAVLTHPTTGWYQRRDARPGRAGYGRYSVWHDVLRPWRCRVRSARFDVFERLGLVEPGAPAHSALAQRRVHFDVHTPPTRLPAGR